jgi:hypothetical protein
VEDPAQAKSFSKCPECGRRGRPDVLKDTLKAIMQDQHRHNREMRRKGRRRPRG